MQIQPINVNSSISAKQPSFGARLKLTFSERSIPCDYNRGEADFSRVIRDFRNWLSTQSPFDQTLTISKKRGKEVDILQTKINGVFQGNPFVNKSVENLEFSMGSGKSGFCWNEQGNESNILEDFKNTFNYVKRLAGY